MKILPSPISSAIIEGLLSTNISSGDSLVSEERPAESSHRSSWNCLMSLSTEVQDLTIDVRFLDGTRPSHGELEAAADALSYVKNEK